MNMSRKDPDLKPLSCLLLILATLLIGAAPTSAQDKDKDDDLPPLRIESIRIGFGSYKPADGQPRFKVGMWAPVYVRLAAGKKGFPEKDDAVPKIQIETNDSEDVGTVYTIDTRPLKPKESETFLGYVRTGNLSTEIRVKILVDGRVYKEETANRSAPELGSLLALSVGGSIDSLQEAIDALNFPPREARFDEFRVNKFAAHEATVRQLPDLGFGYEAVDLMILCASGKTFLKDLAADPNRIKAMSQYVRGGGRLVIPVSWETQDLLHDLLTSKSWQLPLPVVPPRDAGPAKDRTFPRLFEVEAWGQTGDKPFPPAGSAVFAKLDPGDVTPGLWEVLAKSPDGAPLITRMTYGLGNITYLAFPVDETPFKTWAGRSDFLKTLVTRLTPREAGVPLDRRPGDRSRNDIAGDLQRSLDQFDVQIVPFGLVALFIIVYILIVGPLDYLVLKYVFRRLEWTWFTFPAVVLLVSIAAYYTAFALKGQDQKINQVDLVEFDLRTDLGEDLKTKKTYVAGQSFFTILSPRIQSYTIGVKPNPAFLGLPAGAETAAAQPVSWLGRPDQEAWGMGRRGSQGLFRKPYRYAPDATGLEKVPVAVWTTKSFQAGWEQFLETPPFDSALLYHQKVFEGRDVKISGTFQNNLPVELTDVWFISGDRCFPVADPIPAGAKAKIFLESHESKDVATWGSAEEVFRIEAVGGEDEKATSRPRPAPTHIVKSIFFHDKFRFGSVKNHSLRGLDQSWRLDTRARPFAIDASVREVIVYARVRREHGKTIDLAKSTDHPLPTQLWLGELPSAASPPPEILGTMTHDTYIRIYLPLYPADK